MRAIGFALVLIAFVTPQALRSEILEIPMPELQGWYSQPDSSSGSDQRMVVVNLARHPSIVHTAWIELTGEVFVGLLHCGSTSPDVVWGYFFSSMCDDTISGGYWLGSFHLPLTTGSFHITSELVPRYEATWAFLANTSLEILFYGGSAGYPAMCGGVTKPYAFVQDAVFRIDADFDVPVTPETWGSIKSLYKDD